MPVSIWIGLLLCNIAWSINPSIAKLIIQEVGPQHTAWLKYTTALLAYLVGMAFMSKNQSPDRAKTGIIFMKPLERRDLIAVIIIGIATCFISPMAQMLGLQASNAVSNSILITFEPIFAVIFGWIILRERPLSSHYVAFALAVLGFLFLSHTFSALSTSATAHERAVSIGDIILLVAIASESLYSVLGRRLSRIYPGPVVFGTAMLVGAVLLSATVLPWKGLPDFSHLSTRGWFAVLWLGVVGTTGPYLYWLHALNRGTSLGSVVLSLFLQPLIGSMAGMVFLGERMDPVQILGGLLIIGAVSFQVVSEQRTLSRRLLHEVT